MSTTRRSISGLSASALLALAACNATPTLDDENLERVITEEIEAQTQATVTSIDCPADRPLQQGDKFICIALTDVGTLAITVTQTDSAGHVDWAITGQD